MNAWTGTGHINCRCTPLSSICFAERLLFTTGTLLAHNTAASQYDAAWLFILVGRGRAGHAVSPRRARLWNANILYSHLSYIPLSCIHGTTLARLGRALAPGTTPRTNNLPTALLRVRDLHAHYTLNSLHAA